MLSPDNFCINIDNICTALPISQVTSHVMNYNGRSYESDRYLITNFFYSQMLMLSLVKLRHRWQRKALAFALNFIAYQII